MPCHDLRFEKISAGGRNVTEGEEETGNGANWTRSVALNF